jgi:hypothetical protein
MNMEHWWNDRDRVKPKYWKKNLIPLQPANKNPTCAGMAWRKMGHQKVIQNYSFKHTIQNAKLLTF